MAERLGQVLYWIGCGLAAFVVCGAPGIAVFLIQPGHPEAAQGYMAVGAIVLTAAVISLIGRACLYVLAGRQLGHSGSN